MDEEEIQHLRQLRTQYVRSLRALQLQEAAYNIEVPIHIKNGIADFERKIKGIDEQLAAVEQNRVDIATVKSKPTTYSSQDIRTTPRLILTGLIIVAFFLVAITLILLSQQLRQATDEPRTTTREVANETTTARAITATLLAELALTSPVLTATTHARETPQALSTIVGGQTQAVATAIAFMGTLSPNEAIDGKLEYAEGSSISTKCSSVSLRDFTTEARFFNPYDGSTGNWYYGLLFRSGTGNENYRLIISSEGDYELYLANGTVSSGYATGVSVEIAPNTSIDTTRSGSNVIRLVVMKDQAFLFVNSEYIATLDVSSRQTSGYICVFAKTKQEDNLMGKPVFFRDFKIWHP